MRTPIAVVGMACRLPGADDLDEFWRLLTESRDAVVEFPPHRLNRDLYYDGRKGQRGKTYSTIGGLVSERVPVSGDESFDVCHRLFADVAVEACRHAGLGPEALSALEVGVFVGLAGGSGDFGEITLATLAAQACEPLRRALEAQDLPAEEREAIAREVVDRLRRGRPTRTPDGGPKTEARWAAELVAQTLGLSGPNLVLDAACSSSLVALALGALALERQEIDIAIVGGASYAQESSLILFSQAQSCSASGSRPFDEGADGLVGSEGYAAVVLKTEARAREDGDEILAVIPGIGMSTDGRGRHLWAPRKEGQIAAMKRAYGSTLDPGSVQYVEAHATSTQLGDATELEAMVAFFGDRLPGKVPIGSVKSNIGHTLETSGLASLTKVILAMQRQIIPPSINVEKLNGSVDWDSIPFQVAREPAPWFRPNGDVRRAAVSAFGIGGLNVHLVVEEPRAAPRAPIQSFVRVDEPIAIVGRGLVVPGAHDVEMFRSFLRAEQPAVVEAPEDRWPGRIGVGNGAGPWLSPTCRGGFVVDYEYDYLSNRVPPKQLAAANPLQFMLLDATEQALKEAESVDREDTAVVVGTVFSGDFANQLLLGMRFPEISRTLDEILCSRGLDDGLRATIQGGFEKRFFQAFPALLDETGSFTSSTLASRITKAFDLQGGAMAMEAGDASSLMALRTGCSLLRSRVCSAVVCAGAQRALDLPSFESMGLKGYFEHPEYFPGEGVGAVVLKRLDDARRDGNSILGVLLGDACSYGSNGTGPMTATVARRALENAGLERDQVTVVESDGGKSSLSPEQVQQLDGLYPAASWREPDLTRLTGHLGAAEGIVSVIRATVEPPAGLEGLHSESETGLACHVLMGPPPPVVTPRSLGLQLRLGAPTMGRLREKLLYTASAEERPFTEDDRFRLVIVASDPADMPTRLALASTHFGSGSSLLEEQGIFLGEARTPRPRVAFVFSGQGSQYTGMLKELVALSPAARRTMEEADRELKRAGLETFAQLAWQEGSELDRDPVTTQVAVLVADSMVYAAVREAGIEPDCVAGHSFGEIAAMVAARVVSLGQAIRITIQRAQALAQADSDGGLLSVQASLEEISEIIASQDLEIFVTHHNAPQQVVVGGRKRDLADLSQDLTARGFKHTPLKVPGALHTPLVRAAQEPLKAALAREELRPPTKLFYSNVTCDRVSGRDELVANLVAQLVEPQDYPALIDRLIQDGVGALVEVGPGQVLTRLHRQIAGGDVVCTGTDHPRRSAWEQLERARAALECVGAVPSREQGSRITRLAPGTITEFDATAVRRHKRRSAAEALQPVPVETTPVAQEEDSRLARLLLDYVVDLTGYPRAAISLDWDLEADLGLDSIKRAQLVGELSEALGVSTTGEESSSLGDLHTLRQIIAYLESSAAPTTRAPRPDADGVTHPTYEEGLRQGRLHAASIRELLRVEAMNAEASAQVSPVGESMARLSTEERAELQGLADGAGVHVGNIVAYRLRTGVNPGPPREAVDGGARAASGEGAELSPESVAGGTATVSTKSAAMGTSAAAAVEGPLSRRYVMRMVELDHPDDVVGRRLTGTALVVGEGPVAGALRKRLEELGVRVHALNPQSSEAAVTDLEELWEQGPIVHLFLAAGHDPSALDELDASAWQKRRDRILMTPFSLCQRWLTLVKNAGLMDDATLVGFTELGGDLGFAGGLRSFESGALTGLFKAILIESWVSGHRHLPVKVVDAAPSESPEAIAEAALRELAIPSYESEVGIHQGTRRVVRAMQQALESEDPSLGLGKNWVCTGGARGITAFVAGELGRRFGLRLHLIGRASRSEVPSEWRELWPEGKREIQASVMEAARNAGKSPVKAWEAAQKSLEIEDTLERLEAMGVEATYHPCDISDRAALERVLRAVRAEGPIDGILHGAGSSRDAKFEQKERHRVDQCFRAKVDGTLALMDLTRDDPLKYFVAFGSVSGRFGANGHADYSAANDMMAKLVDWYRGKRPEVASVTFHWHAWGDVGMATKAETQLGLQMVDMRFMPAREGVEHLIRELQAGGPEAEVLITDPGYHARFYSQEAAPAERGRGPLLGTAPPESRGQKRVYSVSLDPEKEIFLREHRLDGKPMLPLVVGLELACEAALGDAARPFTLESIETLRGLVFQGPDAQTVRVEARSGETDRVCCQVVSDFCARDGTLLEPDRPILRATVHTPVQAPASPPELAAPAPEGPWTRIAYEGVQSRFYHGPAFQALRRACFHDADMWGAIVAPTIVELGGGGRPVSGWKIHPGVLDACLYAVGFMAWTLEPSATIPVAMERLWVGRFPRPREDCLLRVTHRGRQDGRGLFDFILYGANREPLVEARGYQVAWLTPAGPNAQ